MNVSTIFHQGNGAARVSASRHCFPTNIVTSQHLSIATIQRRVLLYMPMFALLSELWLDIGKSYRNIQVHTTYSDLGPLSPLAPRLKHILTGFGTTTQLLGWGKAQHKQHGQAHLISPTDKWLPSRTLPSLLLRMCM